MRIPDTTGPRPRNRRPESSTSIAPCIRWPPWSRGHLLAVVYGEIERPAPYLRNGLWLSVVRRAGRRVGRAATSSGAPPFRVASDQGAGPFQVVDTERNLRMPAHGAEMDRADDIDPGVAQFSGEGSEGPGLVVKAHDEDGPHRARVAALHDRLARLHRLIHDQAHIRSAARGFGTDRVDGDRRFSENRGEVRELPRPVRDLHVDLDHVPSGRAWQCEATSVARRRVAADCLWDAESLPVGFSCATPSSMSGSRSATWIVPFRSTAMSWGCRSSGVSMSRKPGANGRSFAASGRSRCSSRTGTRTPPGSLPDPIATGTSWTTSRSSARMSSGPTGSCWRKGPGPDTRPLPRGTAGSPTSKTRTESGSS